MCESGLTFNKLERNCVVVRSITSKKIFLEFFVTFTSFDPQNLLFKDFHRTNKGKNICFPVPMNISYSESGSLCCGC